MKKLIVLLPLLCAAMLSISFAGRSDKEDEPYPIPASGQRTGDPASGYRYLTTGDFLKSGIPYELFIMGNGKGHNELGRTGKNANVDYGFNVVTNADSIDIVIPTCLQCHAQVFDGKLVIGLGNSAGDFTGLVKKGKKLAMLRQLQLTSPARYRAVKPLLTAMQTVDPLMETEVQGVNPADRLAAILVAHRDPKTLKWSDKPLLNLPEGVIPTDVPAWWLLKKKNAMFYNGFGRGDFGKFLMLSNILTVEDSSEAREVFSHFGDVLAYIRSLTPPPYPGKINKALAAAGRQVFNTTCAPCHGTYGPEGSYPNLLVPGSIIRTDSMLYSSNQQATTFIDWFNNSWFAQEPYAARLVPGAGYVAPPLDGVWITAPYLHNGSVPTIEGVLNSKLRPTYWTRNFEQPQYDYDHLGWVYELRTAPDGRNAYNTTLPGYSNAGHYFGDGLSDEQRKAVIEYLKTL